MPILILILAISVVLFVLVPLSYIALGKIDNPWEINNTGIYTPRNNAASVSGALAGGGSTGATSGTVTGGTASTEPDVLKRIFGPVYANLGKSDRDTYCSDPAKSLEPHKRDAILGRDDETSIISSDMYNLSLELEKSLTDWNYTNGSLEDELISFTSDNLIINILARTTIPDCRTFIKGKFEDFHTKNSSIEYFSSPTYASQGRSLGLQSATLRTFGDDSIGDQDYYWYLLDETYTKFPDRPIATLWYSTYVHGTEYWFAFRTYKIYEGGLRQKAEDILETAVFN